MRRSRARAFAAPFVLTVVAALPGCQKQKGGDSTVDNVHRNPPRPDPVVVAPYQEWSVSRYGEECSAYVDVSCPPPEEATCNPPPPMTVACPGGLEEGQSMRLLQLEENGPCYVEAIDCGEGCDREPAACPTWE